MRLPQSQAQYLRHPAVAAEVKSMPEYGSPKFSGSSSAASSRSTRFGTPSISSVTPSGGRPAAHQPSLSPRRSPAQAVTRRNNLPESGMLAMVYGSAVEEQVVRLLRLGRSTQQILNHYAIAPHGVTEAQIEAMREHLARSGAPFLAAASAATSSKPGANVHRSKASTADSVPRRDEQEDSDESEREELLEVRFGAPAHGW